MKRVNKFFLIVFIYTGLSLSCVYAQDPTFSQYYASALYLNPAMAGIEPNWALSLNYRSQWRSIIPTPYTTSQASFIVPFYSGGVTDRHLGGAGISVYNDRAGSGFLSTTGVNANFAYNLPLSRMQDLVFAVQAGFVYKSLDFSSLRWGSQVDTDLPEGFNVLLDNPNAINGISQSRFIPDIGAGILYYFNPGRNYDEKGYSGYAGFSAYHLNQPDESLIKGRASVLPFLLKAHAGIEVSLSEKFNVSPNILFAYQNNAYQINAGSYFTFIFSDQKNAFTPNAFIIGGWYRIQDAIIASVGFGNAFYTLGFSYDVNSSGLRTYTGGRGAYEISLKLTKPRAGKVVRYHTPRI